MKRFAQKEICYCTIQVAKAVARPAEIIFFHKHALSEVNIAERVIYRGLGKAQVPFLAGGEPQCTPRNCGEESTGSCIGS